MRKLTDRIGRWDFLPLQHRGGVFLLEVQYSVLKSLISTCVLSYVGSRRRKERIGYLTESASLKRTAGIV